MAKKRQTLHVPGISHGANPIPSGVRIGNVVFSGGISGQDPATNTIPPEPEQQAALAFANLARLMEAAGGSTADIGHVTVYLKDLSHRDHINREWLKLFPNEDDRPTRHTLKADLQGNTLLQLQVIAVID
ncbi:MAG: RidA family protein [Dehalococcoidia bacterium]